MAMDVIAFVMIMISVAELCVALFLILWYLNGRRTLSNKVKEQAEELVVRRHSYEKMTHQLMMALADTIDAKDPYTNGHSYRVASFSMEVAKLMGKDDCYQKDIYSMGLLHDIGKIGIPDHILNKEGRLDDTEYEIIQDHPEIGAKILQNITEMPGLAIGAHWHHEWYDGSGYPDGLIGDEIPEEARIIGVADAYDAMASRRVYSKRYRRQELLEQMHKGKGVQFDPFIADCMIRMIKENSPKELDEMCRFHAKRFVEEADRMTWNGSNS